MNAVNNQHNAEYKIYDPQGNNVAGKLTSVPVGTPLRDCFGTGYVVVNGKEEKPKKYVDGLGSCSNGPDRCGPAFA